MCQRKRICLGETINMNDDQKQLFKAILNEVLTDIKQEEFADLIDTFIEIYEQKFGELAIEMEDEPTVDDVIHVNEASELLKKFRL